jgi:hypothetical protein
MGNRREFLKKAGLGALALGSLPALVDALARPALAQTQRGFEFLTVSAAGPHFLVMGGRGVFDPVRGPASPVEGGGSLFRFQPAASPPFPVEASGTWKARLLTSYREIGTYAGAASGIGEFVVDIQRIHPSPALIRGAVLRVFCNIGAGGFQTGETEGITLSIPGTEFSAGATPGPFLQIPSPPPAGSWGLTRFLLPESLG